MPPVSSPIVSPCRVLLVDDHPITRQGLKALIEQHPGFVVCAETDNSATAVSIVHEASPTLAIVDISLRGENGLELVTQLKAQVPHLPVLVVSMHDEEFYTERARRAGAAGYVMKQHAGDRIVDALRRIVAGQTAFWDPLKRKTWNDAPATTGLGNGIDELSGREREVLALMGSGFTTREIAQKLELSVKTVDTYREKLKVKLNQATGERLIYFAVRWASSQSRGADGTPPQTSG